VAVKASASSTWQRRSPNACLCENADAAGAACGGCRGCLLLRSGNHPDFKLLVPEEERKTVVIDQVRELIDFFT
jgi:DNA polymerase-3 subunit delta'